MDAYVEKQLEKAEKPKKRRKYEEEEEEEEQPVVSDIMPLNKYIAHSGECSRREAAELVKLGKVKVNGELVTDPGHKVTREDKVTVAGKKMTLQTDHVYILLNKPKGFLTTTDDPEGRKTVMELVDNAGVDRIFPVGRLDRNTTGLLLLTNDGALAQKLSHPSFSIKKIYQVTLDKPVTKADFEKIAAGLELEDGTATVDAIAYLEKKNEIGLEIHIGRNRIVRRIFEHLGYQVEKLDRVMYAGLTKKNLPRSKWRFLDPKEVILLKHFKL
ncbi:MAG: rRNA pseudouridine synthase [Flavipsychrobacter sp.]|nr:rRNA pseudouridine synthase [Flavipsychrobacter sp.]